MGNAWTLDKMRNLRERIFNGELEKNSRNQKGCVMIELFDNVEIVNYIFSVLHAEIGIGNYLLNAFFDWIDYRVEEISMEEREKRIQYATNLKDKYKLDEEWETWKQNEGVELADNRIRRKDYNEMKLWRDDDDQWLFSTAERKELNEMSKNLSTIIKELQKGKKVLEGKLRLQKNWLIH